MGRFATTVPLYEKLRPPYPAVFFRNVARRLRLGKEHALIDFGTGPGLLALGFAPYVGRIVGVDPERAMLAATRKAAEMPKLHSPPPRTVQKGGWRYRRSPAKRANAITVTYLRCREMRLIKRFLRRLLIFGLGVFCVWLI